MSLLFIINDIRGFIICQSLLRFFYRQTMSKRILLLNPLLNLLQNLEYSFRRSVLNTDFHQDISI